MACSECQAKSGEAPAREMCRCGHDESWHIVPSVFGNDAGCRAEGCGCPDLWRAPAAPVSRFREIPKGMIGISEGPSTPLASVCLARLYAGWHHGTSCERPAGHDGRHVGHHEDGTHTEW